MSNLTTECAIESVHLGHCRQHDEQVLCHIVHNRGFAWKTLPCTAQSQSSASFSQTENQGDLCSSQRNMRASNDGQRTA